MTRAQYGVPSAGEAWGRKLRDTFLSEGMLQSQVHNALWYRRSTENYDAKTTSPFYGSPIAMQWFEEMMRRNFSIKIEREFTALIGLEINWDKKVGTCEITQRGLINEIAEAREPMTTSRRSRWAAQYRQTTAATAPRPSTSTRGSKTVNQNTRLQDPNQNRGV
jgi:hypothetical protein